MKHPLLLLSALVLCACGWNLGIPRRLRGISRVTYTVSAGTVPEEFQWTERYVISRDGVTFARSGPAQATDLEKGTWQINVDPAEIDALFGRLEAIDVRPIREDRPQDPDDGGGSEIYRIEYGRNKALALVYSEGTTYENGELVTVPVREFLTHLASFPRSPKTDG